MAELEQAPAPFIWGAGGVQMTPERIAAQRKIADAMLARGMDYSPVQHWTQGAARVAQALVGGYENRRAGEAEAANAAADKDWLKGMVSPAAPAVAASPAAPAVVPAPTVLGEGGRPAVADAEGVYGADAVMMPSAPAAPAVAGAGLVPRGIRNNNPLNIEAGSFTSGQPGFAGSDGRFARFATPDQGVSAASKLLDTYQSKYGLNTIQGIVNRWAPAGDGNNVSAYAANVARQMGVDPGAKLNLADPSIKTSLIQAMGQHENGRPITGAEDPAALPPNATPTQGYAIPGQPAAPAAAPASPFGNVNPALLAKMTDPYASEATKKIAGILLQHQMGDKVTYQSQPDGTILQMDPLGKSPPKVVYQGVTKPELKETGTDPITGQKSYQAFDARTNSWVPINGAAGTPNAAGPQSGMLARGVTAVDHDLKGDDYLKQYGPEVQAAVKAYINGDVMPSGNPRMNALASTAKMIAQKYGADMNIPVSDALYTQKRNLIGEFGKGSSSSLGGQRNAGNTAVGHLDELAKQAEGLGNVNLGGWFPIVARGINAARQGASSTQEAKANELNNTIDRYVAEIQKFYSGSSSGGVHEREAARQRFSSVKTPEELAGAIASERDLFHSKLQQLEQQRDDVLGPNGKSMVGEIISPKTREALKRIDDKIRTMRGQKPDGAPTAPPPAALPDGWSVTVR